ncbi:transposase [Actinopolymorpha pittospori]|uniref:Transposase-like protein n=1 Tax=Actinopolymorpha pittospori TaxID=648752 RepID=A0A927MP25_9ACTN|nr:transposase [Actinopolymorpha pittospori]MBE1604074.1 transposase-like protein [Actinopolymorpha pittospori]
MAAPRKYGDELRERATRMAVEARKDPASRAGAIARIAEQLGMHRETLRGWVRQAEIDGGVRPGSSSEVASRIAELERENRELRRANEILRTVGSGEGVAVLPKVVANEEVARRFRWRRRFGGTGPEGVGVIAKGRGRKSSLPAGVVAEVLRLTQQDKAPDGRRS